MKRPASACPRCEGIGSVCQACDRPIDDCECFEDSEPVPCDCCSWPKESDDE